MASMRTTRAGQASAKNPKETDTQENSLCVICDEIILDQSDQVDGQDAIYCEGKCDGWLHRHCAGLSKTNFKIIMDLSKPFVCPHCKLETQGKELSDLKNLVTALQVEISELKAIPINKASIIPRDGSQNTTNYARIVQSEPTVPSQPVSPGQNAYQLPLRASQSQNTYQSSPIVSKSERKFSIVIYGIPECQEYTRTHVRLTQDSEAVSSIIQSVDDKVTEQSIRDCLRLGKYSSTRCRPILVRLSRSCEASSILANRYKLSTNPGVSIKPDMTRQERSIESILLIERRKLINSGTDKGSINIRGNSLVLNKNKYGSVVDSEFIQTKQSPSITILNSTLSTEVPVPSRSPTPEAPDPRPHDTANTLTNVNQ